MHENGSKLLTIKFFCTLQITQLGVEFGLFNKTYAPTWKQLSAFLGFEDQCIVNVDEIIAKFNRATFWKEISNKNKCHRPKTNDFLFPTFGLFING